MIFNTDIRTILLLIPVLVVSLTFHEFAHSLMAYWLGDTTAKYDGRLSLNPLKHIDPIGFLMLIFFRFGWAKPVGVDPRNFRDPKKDMAFTAVAGPLANLLLAFIAIVLWNVIRRFWPMVLFGNAWVRPLFELMVQYNCVLAVFNMIPIPPLDGSKLLYAVLPDRIVWQIMRVEQYGFMVLMFLVMTGVISPVISRGANGIMDALVYVVDLFI